MPFEIMDPDLIAAQKYIYEPIGFECTQVTQESESREYSACAFVMNGKRIIFRVAKITPTKIGQFVTFWKRVNKITTPYDNEDSFDLFVVQVSKEGRFGQFVFPKEALLKHGVISQNDKGGKRAIRVYPAWDITDNKQAKKTQEWQLAYFFEIRIGQPLSVFRIQELYF
jgi:hypothetical protein